MIKKIITSIIIIAIVALAYFSLAKEKETIKPEAKSEDKVMAKIDGKPVYESEIREKIQTYIELNAMGNEDAMNYDKLDKEVKDEIVKSIVVGDLITKEAKQAKTNEKPEYKKGLQFAENQLMQRLFIEKIIKDNLTDEKLQAKYKQTVSEQSNKNEYKVSHILVKTEDEAKQVKQKLDKGEDFAKLAKEFSLDSNKESGGSLAYFSHGQMVPPFEEAVEKLKIGEISAPVKTEFGYHVIKLDEKRQVKVASFEELKSKVSEEISAQFIQEYIEQLKTQNKVEFF
jgi:peptidyl-prolyl cis-trans isomerase C